MARKQPPQTDAEKRAAAARASGVTIDSKGVIIGTAVGKKKFGRLVGELKDVGKVSGEGDPSSPDFVGPPAPKKKKKKGLNVIFKRPQAKHGGRVKAKSGGKLMKHAKVLSRGKRR